MEKFTTIPPIPPTQSLLAKGLPANMGVHVHISCFARNDQGAYFQQLMSINGFTQQQINDLTQRVNTSYETGALANGSDRNYTVTIMPMFNPIKGTTEQWLKSVMNDIREAQENYFHCAHMHLVLDPAGFPDLSLLETRWHAMATMLIPPTGHLSVETEMVLLA